MIRSLFKAFSQKEVFMNTFSLLKSRINLELQPTYSAADMGLSRVETLHEMLGFPEHSFHTIHVTGSKGKGSTSAMLGKILQEAGFRVGMYTSPHILKLEERIQINGNPISHERLNAILEEKIRPAAEKMEADAEKAQGEEYKGKLTAFEILTVAAFQYFSEENVDFAVVEVGLGGRTDATNICTPCVCVITNIALEHTAQLGGTVEEIAREKAGILKGCVPVVVGAMRQEVYEKVFPVIHAAAEKCRASDVWAGKQFPEMSGENFTLGMPGEHQRRNAAVVMKVMELFRPRVSSENIRKGLELAKMPGRLEIVQKNPALIFDAAHSPESMAETVRWVLKTFSDVLKRVIFASAGDKKWREMLNLLLDLHPETLILTEFPSKRSVSAAEMSAYLHEAGKNEEDKRDMNIVCISNPQEALKLGEEKKDKNFVLLVTGSFFLLREIYGREKS